MLSNNAIKDAINYHKIVKNMYSSYPQKEQMLILRTVNTAIVVARILENISFEDMESFMYIRATDLSTKKLIRMYESMLEFAQLNPREFILQAHNRYKDTSSYIIESNMYLDYLDLCDAIIRKTRKNKNKLEKDFFDAYMSLILQQSLYISYYIKKSEVIFCGCSNEGTPIFINDPFPYSDYPSYDLEKYVEKGLSLENIDFNIIKSIYAKYGYQINNMEEMQLLDAKSTSYSNNLYYMASYINQDTIHILPTTIYANKEVTFPRFWKDTKVYKEKLKKRNYVIPPSGITALYKNAGSIQSISFLEIYKNDRIIMLYKVSTSSKGDFSGYYDTYSQDFYALYENTNLNFLYYEIENFILENYMYLTCRDVDIDRKRNMALKQVEDINGEEDYFENQPIVCFLTKKTIESSQKTNLVHYDKNKYESENKPINGYIRKLPAGQSASYDAKKSAELLGYELNINETYVRPFSKHILKLKEVK